MTLNNKKKEKTMKLEIVERDKSNYHSYEGTDTEYKFSPLKLKKIKVAENKAQNDYNSNEPSFYTIKISPDKPRLNDEAIPEIVRSRKPSENFEINFHGFAGDARKYGNREFERSLENLEPRINKMKFLSKFNTTKTQQQLNIPEARTVTLQRSKDNVFDFSKVSPITLSSNWTRPTVKPKSKTSNNLPTIYKK